VIPAKQPGHNLLLGTWNLRAFDRLTPKWHSAAGDSPIRDLSNLLCIAEVIRRFDIIAIQEVRSSAQALLAMLQVLGDDWAFLVTDVTGGTQGNHERLAFVFDRQRVRPSGLACELVVAAEDAGIPQATLQGQFARTPYACSFTCQTSPFTLVTLHVTYGQGPQDRVAELKEIARWLARWAKQGDAWGTNLIAIGDFNIDRQDDPLYQAFTSTGLRPPAGLNHVPRTIFDDPDPAAPPDHPTSTTRSPGSLTPPTSRPCRWRTPTLGCSTSPPGSSKPPPGCSCRGGSPTTSPCGSSTTCHPDPPRGPLPPGHKQPPTSRLPTPVGRQHRRA
jgi:endonuclease/exonuclease/phosphatase family metal-dependent hydrolase